MTSAGADTNPLFDVPWWFRTDFTASLRPGQDAKLVINGVVGPGRRLGERHRGRDRGDRRGRLHQLHLRRHRTCSGRGDQHAGAASCTRTTRATMFTLDDVDWTQIPPDNNTGIQFPVQLHVAGRAGHLQHLRRPRTTRPDMSTRGADRARRRDQQHRRAAGRRRDRDDHARRAAAAAIQVTQPVTLAAGASHDGDVQPRPPTASSSISHPQLWWPYQMGGQPLYRLRRRCRRRRRRLRRGAAGRASASAR